MYFRIGAFLVRSYITRFLKIRIYCTFSIPALYYYIWFFSGLECVDHSFASVAHLIFLRDVWTRTQRAAEASRL
jgi:hypothetical protein